MSTIQVLQDSGVDRALGLAVELWDGMLDADLNVCGFVRFGRVGCFVDGLTTVILRVDLFVPLLILVNIV